MPTIHKILHPALPICLLLVLVRFPVAIFAQTSPIKFKHLTVEDGLAHNRVWRILHDRKGFLWFATGYGLSRYDGYNFTNFQKHGAGTLSHDAIWAIFEDHAGTLWVGTYGGGLNKFDASTQTFVHYQHDPDNPNSLSNNIVRAIHELSGEPGVLWIATIGGGLNRFDTRTEIFTSFQNDPHDSTGLASNSVHTLHETRDGVLWLGSGNGFSRLDGLRQRNAGGQDAAKGISFRNYRFKPGNAEDLFGGGVTTILESKDGALWLGANQGGLSLFNRQAETYIHFTHDPDDPKSLSHGSVRKLFEDRAGNIWIGIHGGGLNKFDRVSRTFVRYQHDPDNPHSLSNDVVRDIFEDPAGVLWVATFGGGVNKIVPGNFALFRHEPNNPGSLRRNHVTHIHEDARGAIWLFMQGGALTRIDMKGGEKPTYTHYGHEQSHANSLGQNNVQNFIESRDQPGVFWLGVANLGLVRFDSNAGRFLRLQHEPGNSNSISSDRITSIHQSLQQPKILWICAARGQLNRLDVLKGTFTRFDLGVNSLLAKIYESPHEPGVLWVGTTAKGLIRFDSQNHTFKHLLPDDLAADLPAHIEMIHESPKRPGILWVSTDREGFYKIVHDASTDETTLKHFKHEGDNPNSLLNDKLWAFCETPDGILWFGSEKGLSRFDPEEESFINYTVEQGLSGNFVQSMLCDDRGNIWIATNGGLSKFTPATQRFRNYTVSDGLQGHAFNPVAFAKGRDGRLYFGGANGMNMFHPDSMKDNLHVPRVAITDFRIFNKPVKIAPDKDDEEQTLPAHFSTLHEIVLSHRENVFSFEFAALDYTAPEKNQYAYKMEGFHDDWIHTGATRTATFTNLDPGDYVFRIKASNNDAVWNEEGASVRVTILPPWWQTWWAYTLYAFFTGLALFVLLRYEKNRQQHKHDAGLRQREAEKLYEMDALKSRFFANISHEFRTPLTLILGHTEGALPEIDNESAKNKLKIALRNTAKLRTLINQLLDLSKFEAGRMELHAAQQDIVPVLRAAVASFESYAAQKGIALAFSTNPAAIPVFCEREQIEKVMYNLLSNALKFTLPGGEISVKVEVESETGRVGERGRTGEGGTRNGQPDSPLLRFTPSPSRSSANAHELKITVRDSGIGIPPESLPNIFDRFYQVNASETHEHEGTGIGLALVQELIQLHGGMISVESEAGAGTTFTIKLPLGSEHLRPEQVVAHDARTRENGIELISPTGDAIPQPSRSQELPGAKSADAKLVLIVEDNEDMRALLRDNLSKEYRVIEAANGESGFAAAFDAIPDLIITDVMMPVMDGYNLTHRLRAHAATSHIPIIMLTARAADEDKFEGLEKGVDVYLTKPFNKQELLIRVRKLIELRQQLLARVQARPMITASEVMVTSMDQQFLERLQKIVEENMGEETFQVEDLGRQIGLSRSQLQRKLAALLDCSPAAYLRRVRLERAKQLLEKNAGTVTEICFQVGYGNVSAFARAFREAFGESPSTIRTKSTA